MYHDENPSNVSTSFPFIGAPTDYPYDPAYAPLMGPSPVIGEASGFSWGFQQDRNWMTAPAPSTVTQSQPNLRYQELRPLSPHQSAPTSPSRDGNKEEHHKQHQELRRRKHSKRQIQLDHEQVQRTAKKALRIVSEVIETTNQPVRDDEVSTAKTPSAPTHDSATQSRLSWPPNYLLTHQDDTAQPPAEILQEALKIQVLESIRVLREIARNFRAFNLELQTINGWITEIKGADATLIPVPSSTAVQILVPFESLNLILMECLIASGPRRGFIIRDQALELLKYIYTYAEKYHLFQNPRVYFEIGRWIERLSPGNHDEQSE